MPSTSTCAIDGVANRHRGSEIGMASPINPFLITVGISPSRTTRFEAWWERILEAWPDPDSRPACRIFDNHVLAKRLDGQSTGSTDLPQGPVLVIVEADTSDALAYQLADELQQARIPGILLLPAGATAQRDLQESGLIIASHEALPGFVSAALFTLALRQSTVRELNRELTIAARAAGGVRGQMDRIHEELNLAASVQQEMMPKAWPKLPGLDCAAMLRPAGYVSGDIYDLAAIDEHRVVFFIADAVGHGVPAAMMTMVISRAMRIDKLSDFVSPGETLSKLNDELCRAQRDTARFTTAVYGVYDARSRQVTIASAGHPPPLLIGPAGVTRVPCEGALMGIFPGERFENCTFELHEGETLLLFSDGFEVAFAPGPESQNGLRRSHDPSQAEHYIERLAGIRWPDGHDQRTAADAMEDLARLIDIQAGSLHQIDDLTAIAITRRAEAGASNLPMTRAA
jgi:phosphoserine phosphatase RsbU/P